MTHPTYYARNREARLASARDYKRRNREHLIVQSMDWDDRNREKARERWRRYRRNNPHVHQAWLAKNKKRRDAQKREYDRRNRNAKRLARKLGVSIQEARMVLNAITAKSLARARPGNAGTMG